jgi:hypothetical protein
MGKSRRVIDISLTNRRLLTVRRNVAKWEKGERERKGREGKEGEE